MVCGLLCGMDAPPCFLSPSAAAASKQGTNARSVVWWGGPIDRTTTPPHNTTKQTPLAPFLALIDPSTTPSNGGWWVTLARSKCSVPLCCCCVCCVRRAAKPQALKSKTTGAAGCWLLASLLAARLRRRTLLAVVGYGKRSPNTTQSPRLITNRSNGVVGTRPPMQSKASRSKHQQQEGARGAEILSPSRAAFFQMLPLESVPCLSFFVSWDRLDVFFFFARSEFVITG